MSVELAANVGASVAGATEIVADAAGATRASADVVDGADAARREHSTRRATVVIRRAGSAACGR